MNSLEQVDRDYLEKVVDDLLCGRTDAQAATTKIIVLPKTTEEAPWPVQALSRLYPLTLDSTTSKNL